MSRIWFKEYSLSELNQRNSATLAEVLDIEFTEIGKRSLSAHMPVSQKHRQPVGIVHGGANVVLAETVASTAANMVVDQEISYCVGLEINANHLRSVREGLIIATAEALHLGRTTQVWNIFLYDSDNKLSCISRMTAAVIERKKQK